MLYKLAQDHLVVVVRFIFELREGAHPDHVAVGSHHRDGLEDMFRFVAIHDYPSLGLQFPSTLVNIEHDHVHPEVHSCFLGTQPGTEARVEENH